MNLQKRLLKKNFLFDGIKILMFIGLVITTFQNCSNNKQDTLSKTNLYNKRQRAIQKNSDYIKQQRIAQESLEEKSPNKEKKLIKKIDSLKELGTPNSQHIYFLKNGVSESLEFTTPIMSWHLENNEYTDPCVCSTLRLVRNDFEDLGLIISDASVEIDMINNKEVLLVRIDFDLDESFSYHSGTVEFAKDCPDEEDCIMMFKIKISKAHGGVKIIGPYYFPPETI